MTQPPPTTPTTPPAPPAHDSAVPTAPPAAPARKPSAWGYIVAAALLAVGVAAFLAAVLPARAKVHDAVHNLQRITFPAGGTFSAAAPGPVTFYYEKHGLLDGKPHQSPMRWRPETLGLQSMDGQHVDLTQPFGNDLGAVIYHVGPYIAEGIFTADLPAAGTYRLTLGTDEAADLAPPRILAVGHVPTLLEPGVFNIYGAAVTLAITAIAAVLLAIITWSRRRDAALRMAK